VPGLHRHVGLLVDVGPVEQRDAGLPVVATPSPGVAEPQLRHQVEGRRVRSVVRCGDTDHDVRRCRLGVRHNDVEEPVLGEDPRVAELELVLGSRPFGVLGDQLVVRKCRLRIPVEVLPERVGGRGVKVPPVLLDVLPVVALRVGQPEQPLLEPVVVAVPHRDREVEEPEPVAEPGDPVLAPAVCASVRLVEGEVRPCVTVGGVVLANRPPLAPRDVRTPEPPRVGVVWRLGEPGMLGAGLRRSATGGTERHGATLPHLPLTRGRQETTSWAGSTRRSRRRPPRSPHEVLGSAPILRGDPGLGPPGIRRGRRSARAAAAGALSRAERSRPRGARY